MSKVTPRESIFSPVLNLSCPHPRQSIHKYSKDSSKNPKCSTPPHQTARCFLFLHYQRGLNNFQPRSPALDFCYPRMRLYPSERRGLDCVNVPPCSVRGLGRGQHSPVRGEQKDDSLTFPQANLHNSTPHPKPPNSSCI